MDVSKLSLAPPEEFPAPMGKSDDLAFAADMHKRATILLEELEQFKEHLKEIKKDKQVVFGDFKKPVQQVLTHLNSFLNGGKITVNTITNTNLPFYECLWSVAKTCEGITAIRQLTQIAYTKPKSNREKFSKNGHTFIDIVAQNGSEWVKVSRLTEKRVLWELAKAGWNADSDSEDGEEGSNDKFDDSEGLLKTMTNLIKASRLQKVRFRHPSIRLILPELSETSKPVKDLMDQIRSLGVTIQTADDLSPIPIPISKAILDHMTAERISTFTATLNIDCSIVLAFASDISHNTVQPQEWHNDFIARQIKVEIGDLLLPRTLWPACGSRKLVCTRESADKVQEIVDIVGTEIEKARTAILLGGKGLTREQSVVEFQKLSDYDVPKDWQIPIQIVDVDIEDMRSKVPDLMGRVLDNLLDVNQSTFLFGWTAGMTTITSNGVVARAIERALEESDIPEPEVGFPDTWVCQTPRSLVGKEVEKEQKKRTAGAVRQSKALRNGR